MAAPEKNLNREEVAAIEIGRTDISRGLAGLLVVLFVGLIALVPLLQHLLDARGFQQGARDRVWPGALSIFQQAPVAFAAGDGVFDSNRRLLETIGEYESDLEDASVLTKTALGPVQAFLTDRLGVGNEEAYLGDDGWLYYRPGFDHVTGPAFLDKKRLQRIAKLGERQPDPVEAIVDFKKQLESRGIDLLVLPVAVKPSVHPQPLGGNRSDRSPAPVTENPSMDELRATLEERGIQYALLSAPGYLKADTHWKPEAMERGAQVLGDLVRALDAHNLQPRRASGYTRGESVVTNQGDIAVMLQLPEDQELFPPETVTIHPVKTAGGRPWRSREDADILLLGDSFANIYSVTNMNWGGHAGLAEQLSFYLQRPVDKLCINDHGAYASRELLQAELRAGKDRLAGKKVVIWEFAARELSVGDWKKLKMKLKKKPDMSPGEKVEKKPDMSPGEKVESDGAFYLPEPGTTQVVQAVVAARSPVPRPGSVPYKHHICVLHLKELKDLDGNTISDQAAVYTWSMRDNSTTRAGKLKRGDSVKLRLQSWEDVSDKWGSENRSELLDDDAFLLAYFCWGEPLESLVLVRTIPFPFYVYMLFVFAFGLTAMLRARVANGALDKMNKIKIASGSLLLTLLCGALLKVSAAPQDRAVSGPDVLVGVPEPVDPDALGLFRAAAAKLDAKGTSVLEGEGGWLFMAKELRHLGLGEFWGPRAADVSQARNPANADPLPTVLDFNSKLKALGIELIFMPVPPKAAIYADKAVGAHPTRRVDVHHARFLAMLRKQGVNVIDLAPLFLKAKSGDERVYCLQDTHWARLGMEIAAKEVGAIIKNRPWYAAAKKLKLDSRVIDMPLEGDLLSQLGHPLVEPVTEKVQNITQAGQALQKDPNSPILILGDSHALFLHDGGDMHAVGSGFPDLLAFELGTSYDLIANRGSGVGSARLNLAREFLRKPVYRGGKKVVIWLFAGRDFTETSDGTDWKILPMMLPMKRD
jgi:alginate O-acetyltransferase complex protein AlgJ